MTPRRFWLPTVLAAALAVSACAGTDEEPGDTITASPRQPSESATPSESTPERGEPGDPRVVATVAQGLEAPWGLAFLPDGSALVTERDTRRLLHVTGSGEEWDVEEVATVDAATPEGEGGLLGVAVSPTYDKDRRIFLYASTAEDNRVLRATYDESGLGQPESILDGIPQGFIHDGGRLEFGPDGYLYVSTGESGEPPLAQDDDSLGGKILRIDQDGEPAEGNPDGDSPVYSLGHRNIQGLAFDSADRLWASEFGDQTWDELNLIEPGENYGWPDVEGHGSLPEYQNPQVVWSPAESSPSGLAYLEDRLWLASLRGERLWRVDVADGKASRPRDFFIGRYGRLRTVVAAPDGNLWVTTSNRDTRGEPGPDDDQILVVDPGLTE